MGARRRILLQGAARFGMAMARRPPASHVSASEVAAANNAKVDSMFYTIAVVLLVLWVLGLVSSYTMGGFIHILLVVAIVMVLVNLITGRRAL
jgi:uncharacterized membrane protein YtjA (UPF0391 family)